MAKVSPRKQWSGRSGPYPASISLRHIAKAGALALTSNPSALQRSDFNELSNNRLRTRHVFQLTGLRDRHISLVVAWLLMF